MNHARKMRLMIVIGTRPEAIKIYPLIKAARLDPRFELSVIFTGQHDEMMQQISKDLNLVPDRELNSRSSGSDILDFGATLLTEISEILKSENPDLVLIHGDTATTLFAGLAAFYGGFPVGHVEAGLRTRNLKSPFPEEFNRQAVSRLAYLHFAPTNVALQNLISEGLPSENITVVGNTVVDSVRLALEELNHKGQKHSEALAEISSQFDLGILESSYVVVTAHRRENIQNGLEEIFMGIRDASKKHPEFNFIFPVHLNPQVSILAKKIFVDTPKVRLTKPFSYFPFLLLLSRCRFIISDSGGIQEEAVSLNKPMLVTRSTTERSEGIAGGLLTLVESKRSTVSEAIDNLIIRSRTSQEVRENPFGDGFAAEKILEFIFSKSPGIFLTHDSK